MTNQGEANDNFRVALALASLPLIVPACALDVEDELTETQLKDAEQADSKAAAIEANAQLEAQAAAGNRGAQQVLQGMEKFRRRNWQRDRFEFR